MVNFPDQIKIEAENVEHALLNLNEALSRSERTSVELAAIAASRRFGKSFC